MAKSILKLPKYIGHRGAAALAPENTLAAMHKAKSVGAQWVEFDVMLTADGEAIVIHDKNVKRTSNGKGEVGQLTLAEIKLLDAGSWFDSQYAEEKIPTLVEMISCLSELNLGANIEIKPYPGKARETAVKIVEIIQQYWPEHLPKPLISSFEFESLYQVRELDAEMFIGVLMHLWNSKWETHADALNAVTVHMNRQIATATRVEAIKQSGRLALSYTVNDLAQAERLFQLGIDAIFTDHPEIFSKL